MVLAANQRRLRVAAALSQAELAAAASVTKSTIAAIEQGRANPRLTTLESIAAALRVEVAELVASGGPPAVEVVRAGPELLAAGARMLDVPARHERELPAEDGGRRFLYVVDGQLVSGPVEAPTELDAGDSAAFSATSPMLLRTGRRSARALLLTIRSPRR